MEIPVIRGGGHSLHNDLVQAYFYASAAETVADDSFESRCWREIMVPGVTLLLRNPDSDRFMDSREKGEIAMATKPVAYALEDPEHEINGPDLAMGTLWLEGLLTFDNPVESIAVPKITLAICARANGAQHVPVWLLKTDGQSITRNIMSGQVVTYDHGTLNLFASLIDDIGEVVFAQENAKLKQDRQEEERQRLLKLRGW